MNWTSSVAASSWERWQTQQSCPLGVASHKHHGLSNSQGSFPLCYRWFPLQFFTPLRWVMSQPLLWVWTCFGRLQPTSRILWSHLVSGHKGLKGSAETKLWSHHQYREDRFYPSISLIFSRKKAVLKTDIKQLTEWNRSYLIVWFVGKTF